MKYQFMATRRAISNSKTPILKEREMSEIPIKTEIR